MKNVLVRAAFILRSNLTLIAFIVFLIGLSSINKTMPMPFKPVQGASTVATIATFIVNNAGDNGIGSLRQAIIDANANSGTDMITFNIPGAGPHIIALTTSLPTITSPVIIDGYTQPGASLNTLSDADNAILLIELNGDIAGTGVNGLTIDAGSSVVRGLKISDFSFSGILLQGAGSNRIEGNFITGNSSRGIVINAGASNNMIGGTTPGLRNIISSNGSQGVRILAGSTANSVQGNFIGIDAEGIGSAGNFNEGIFLNSSDNIIGGTTPGARNIISGSLNASGLTLAGPGATGNLIQGNYIGTDATGIFALGNKEEGILIDGNAAANTIGGVPLSGGNVISGNKQNGIVLGFASPVNGNKMPGNFIGTQADGVSPLGNGQDGISLVSGSNNLIGDLISDGNVIAFNGLNGVAVQTGTGNSLLSNSIFSNSLLGIDLGSDGVTANDTDDADAGANNLQNFPQLTSATVSLGSTIIQGTFNGTPNTTFTLQFFSNAACDDSGFGEGQQLIGTRTIQTDAGGNAIISFSFPGQFSLPVTMTATDPSGSTSEFSKCTPDTTGINLAISKTASPGVVKPGDTLTYMITAINNGSTIADNVTVVDILPNSVTFGSCSATGNGSCLGSGNDRRVVFAALPAGASATITFVTTVKTPLPNGTLISNTATISSPAPEAGSADNVATTTVIVSDAPPAIICPGNIVRNAVAGQCLAVVEYPLPTLNDTLTGATIICSPPSSSAFPAGVTTVNCVAGNERGQTINCAFTITVNSPSSARVTLENNATALSFGPAEAKRKTKKPPKGCDCDSTFTIENTGCATLNLALDSIMRIGSDVTSGKIANPDDSKTFSVKLVNNNQSETDLDIGTVISIPTGQTRSFRVLFKPGLPALTGKTTGLAAADVLPDLITSKITFRQNGIEPIVVNLVGRISTNVQIINPDDARASKRAVFTKSGNEFTVIFGIFDADLDVNRATFEFLDGNGQVVEQAFDVDLTQPISQNNLIKGQSFVVTQKFTGAASHPEVASVRVKVSDLRSSDSVTAQLGASAALLKSLQNPVMRVVVHTLLARNSASE